MKLLEAWRLRRLEEAVVTSPQAHALLQLMEKERGEEAPWPEKMSGELKAHLRALRPKQIIYYTMKALEKPAAEHDYEVALVRLLSWLMPEQKVLFKSYRLHLANYNGMSEVSQPKEKHSEKMNRLFLLSALALSPKYSSLLERELRWETSTALMYPMPGYYIEQICELRDELEVERLLQKH